MRRYLFTITAVFALMLTAGCSDNDTNPVNDNDPDNTSTSAWDDANDQWITTIDASGHDDFVHFSFATQDTVTVGATKQGSGGWDIAFRREVIKTNGGASAEAGGDVEGADLGQVNFAAVTIDDTTDADWAPDGIDYFMGDWYEYNFQTHEFTITGYVYSMVDAEGDNYVKFRVDSLVGGGMGSMGTVYLSYYYQPTAGSLALDGVIQQGTVEVGAGTGYFDFSSGAAVTPADPANSTEWDIAFHNYNLMQNSGPNGTGECAAFYAWGELTDPTDIEGFDAQPIGAPLFTDIPSSVMTDWYNYNGMTHQLTSKSHVYLLKTGGTVYKLRIESYYKNVGGVPTSGHYSFVWKEL